MSMCVHAPHKCWRLCLRPLQQVSVFSLPTTAREILHTHHFWVTQLVGSFFQVAEHTSKKAQVTFHLSTYGFM